MNMYKVMKVDKDGKEIYTEVEAEEIAVQAGTLLFYAKTNTLADPDDWSSQDVDVVAALAPGHWGGVAKIP